MDKGAVQDYINSKYIVKELLYQKFGLDVEVGKPFKCPFHDDSTASARLYNDNKFFCYGCRNQFSAYSVLIKIGISYKKMKSEVPIDFKISSDDGYIEDRQGIIDTAKYLSLLFMEDNNIINLLEKWSVFYSFKNIKS